MAVLAYNKQLLAGPAWTERRTWDEMSVLAPKLRGGVPILWGCPVKAADGAGRLTGSRSRLPTAHRTGRGGDVT